jgi:hypothetical protein
MKSVAKANLSPWQRSLLVAGKAYSAAAKAVAARAPQVGSAGKHQLIGVGVAADWTRRAAGLSSISFAGRLMNRSDRAESFTELLRFSFAWSGLNAIFARDELLRLFGSVPNSEFDRFHLLYKHSTPSLTREANRIATLHGVLAAPLLGKRAAGSVQGVTTLQALHSTYVPISSAGKGASKKIGAALAAGSWASLDVPLLIYALRNWSVHGNTIDSSFRSKPRFLTYVTTLTDALADVHMHTSSELARRL